RRCQTGEKNQRAHRCSPRDLKTCRQDQSTRAAECNAQPLCNDFDRLAQRGGLGPQGLYFLLENSTPCPTGDTPSCSEPAKAIESRKRWTIAFSESPGSWVMEWRRWVLVLFVVALVLVPAAMRADDDDDDADDDEKVTDTQSEPADDAGKPGTKE